MGRLRGGDKLYSVNWGMLGAVHKLGQGSFILRSMLSLEPATDPPSSTRVTALVSMRSGGRLPRHQAAMLSTIFPRLCGAPPSISWALRASSSGSTVPTFVTNFPLSNSSETSFSRAVVTST